jgi:hypothetical protein
MGLEIVWNRATRGIWNFSVSVSKALAFNAGTVSHLYGNRVNPVLKALADAALLLLGLKLAGSATQGVGERDGHGLAVRGHGVAGDANHFPIAFVGFLERVLAGLLDRYTGGARITLVGGLRAIEFCRVTLSCGSGHGQGVAFDLERNQKSVVGQIVYLGSPPGAGNQVGASWTLCYSSSLALASDWVGIGVRAVGKHKGQSITIGGDCRF